MDVMKFTEEEWLEVRAEAKRRYHREVMRRRFVWQKCNGVIIVLMSLLSWHIFNGAGHLLINIPGVLIGLWIVSTKEVMN